jgi:hypothetical protein
MVQAEIKLSPSDLLRAVEQLEVEDLDAFTQSVIALRAARAAPGLAADEARLLEKIGEPPERHLQQRYDQLVQRRREETLTPEEHQELLQLSDQMEALDVRRVEALAELARIRGVTLRVLMQELGLNPRARG